MTPSLVGIEIGGTKLQIVWGNADLEINDRASFRVNATAGAQGILTRIQAALTESPHPAPHAIGVGFGGPVDWTTGRIWCSHQIAGWSGFELGSWLTQLTGAPARIENDANTAALAEALRGAGRERNPVFYVTLGSGVGGGLVVDRSIFHGQMPGETEIGHLRLEPSGVTVEERCSGWAVNRIVKTAAEANSQSPLAAACAHDPGHEARHLGAALAANDPVAERIVTDLAADLAYALSHVTHLVHPETIVLGGGLSMLGEPLRAAIAERLPSWTMEAFKPGPEIAIAKLGADAVPVGGLQLAAQCAGTGPIAPPSAAPRGEEPKTTYRVDLGAESN